MDTKQTDFYEPRDPVPHLIGREVYYTCTECGGILSYEDKVGRLACADCDYGWRKMKRTKEWWAALTKDERAKLVWLEKSTQSTRSAYLPEDCSECNVCGTPILGSGLCDDCYKAWKSYIDKANGATNATRNN